MLDINEKISLTERLRGESESLFSLPDRINRPPVNPEEVVFSNAEDEFFQSQARQRNASGLDGGDGGDDGGESETDDWGPDGKPGTADDTRDEDYDNWRSGKTAQEEAQKAREKEERNPPPPNADEETEKDPDY